MSSLIVDFDGTLADSLPLVLDLFYKWSGKPKFSTSELEHFRGMHAKEILSELRIPIWKVPGLLVKNHAEFGKRINEVPIFSGIAEALKALASQGHKLHIMSTNSTQNIDKFIKANNIGDIFDSINGNVGVFGKTSAMKIILKRHKIKRQDCYSIGDEVRDIEAARKVGIKSIAVTWGYNNATVLKKHSPDFLVDKPSQLVKLVK